MSRYACIDAANTVVQVVEWDGQTPWSPPEGQTPVLLPDYDFFIEPQGTLDPKTLTFVRAVPPIVTKAELEAAIPKIAQERTVHKIDALLDVLAEKGTITPADVEEIEKGEPKFAVITELDSPP